MHHLKKLLCFFCWFFTSVSFVSAVDSSGRNSHFWVTVRPDAGSGTGGETELTLTNGYRSETLASSLLSCQRDDEGSARVYQITWQGNHLIDGPEADQLQFTIVMAPESSEPRLRSIFVNGSTPDAVGLVLESSFSKVIPRKLNGRRPPKGYFEIQGSIVLRDLSQQLEDPEHPFSDLHSGHTMGAPRYGLTSAEKLKHFPKFSWDHVPRGMLIRKSQTYSDQEVRAIAENYDLVVLEKANGAGFASVSAGMKDTAARLKVINPDIKVLFYWNSRIFFGHYGIDDTITRHRDEWIDPDFVIRGRLPTYVRDNPDFLKWWVGCAEKMISDPSIDGTFVDKAGVPIYMLDALYRATPLDKLVMNNNSSVRERIGYVDGTYREDWMGGGDPDTIAETIAIARETGQHKKMQILRMPVKGVANPRELEDSLDSRLAIYLIYVEEYAYFYLQATVDATQPMWQWEASYADQLQRPLGKPLGPYMRDNHVYVRSFEHCDVYLNLNSGADTRILWKNDIGSPSHAGSGLSSTIDTYKLEGSGFIGGAADQFFYLSDAHYGDGHVKASVDAFVSPGRDAKAGVMYRASLAADDKMVAVLRDPAGRMYMVYRSSKGANVIGLGSVDAPQKRFAMLVRKGDRFLGYCSSDEINWTPIGEVDLPMEEKIEMGMAIASHDDALAEVRISGFVRIETSNTRKHDLDNSHEE
ncbi:putative glycoside hydrolase [Coraliomargarita sp. SDUM461004]|uniref:Glycoside hydrolase n=1 Tax=Thalassobacterium sedimentorum TaxID=3041258 RepID=A0ABU1APV4_9BACT|nr:putative glycoside hydrolase [Coraliomargarita sp. SDUM461004]MDQ8196263.1 putative glycoside hydrolase [Coraliomargarita sp. SDUM461004]